MLAEVKNFKDSLVDTLQSSRKTTYGKNELVMLIKDFYTEYLEKKQEQKTITQDINLSAPKT